MGPLLAWQAPAECPGAAAVQARLAEVLASLPNGWDRERSVRGKIARRGVSDWVLELQIAEPAARGGSPRQRRLTAAHCDELAETAAVAIALALGNAAAGRLAVSEPPPVASPLPVSQQAAIGDGGAHDQARYLASDASSLRRPHRSAIGIQAGAVADSGLLASIGWGATLGVHARFDAWGLGLYGVWLPKQAHSLAPEQGVNFGLLTAGLRGCYRALDGGIGLDGCLGLELGSLSATGYGLAYPQQSREALWAPLAGAAVTWRAFEHWAFVSRLDGLIPLPRQQYMVDIDQRVHETPSLALRLVLGVEGELIWR